MAAQQGSNLTKKSVLQQFASFSKLQLHSTTVDLFQKHKLGFNSAASAVNNIIRSHKFLKKKKNKRRIGSEDYISFSQSLYPTWVTQDKTPQKIKLHPRLHSF